MSIARMLQACYSGDYGSEEHETHLAGFLANAFMLKNRGGPSCVETPDFGTAGLVVHAKMYALGDKYDIPNLRRLAFAKFGVCIKSAEVSNEDVLAAGRVVYENLPRTDDKLRKLVVYYTQTRMLELTHLHRFKDLMSDSDFSWDYGTKYASRAHLWCPDCVDWTPISAKCSCGFNGLCEKSEVCKRQDWDALTCGICKKQGRLLREEPEDQMNKVAVGAGQDGKKGNALPTPPHTPKKRKH